MYKNVYVYGIEGNTVTLAELDINTHTIKRMGLNLNTLFGLSEFACENLVLKNGEISFNGKRYNADKELMKALNESNYKWIMVEKLTDNEGKTIGYGVIHNGEYKRFKLELAIQRIGSCANAFIRDGVLVNKLGETSEANILSTVKKDEKNMEISSSKGCLMLANSPVLKYDFNENIVAVVDGNKLPFGIRGAIKNSAMVINAAVKNITEFKSWLASRVLPLQCESAKNILNALRLSQSNDIESRVKIALACKALSLTDGYWIKYDGSNDTWDSVNLFENRLNESLMDVALGDVAVSATSTLEHPELTTEGLFTKAWVRENGKTYLMKSDRTSDKLMTKAELVASDILDCFNIEHVKYTSRIINGKQCCLCENLANKNVSLVSYEQVDRFCKRNGKSADEFIRETFGDKSIYNKMFCIDYIISNTDRHSENIAFYMNNETGKISGIAKLYDHNLSLAADITGASEKGIACTLGGYSELREAALANKNCGLRLIKSIESVDFREFKGAKEKVIARTNEIVGSESGKTGLLSGINFGNGSVTIQESVIDIKPSVPLMTKNESASAAGAGNDKSDIDRMKELIEKLNEAARVYEQGEDEIMSNYEYDALYDELMLLEGKTGTILANSPTQKVGYEAVSNLPKEEHETPMLSLGKTKDVSDLRMFLGTKEGELSWKLDGITVVLTYEGGELKKAVTRGNGYVGELVTNNAKTFINLPKRISRMDKIVLRCEALISYAEFDKIKATPEGADYKNPRNLCSGSVRQLDSSITAKRNVRAVVFEWVNAPLNMSKHEQLDFCKGLGFEVVQSIKVTGSNVETAVAVFNEKVAEFKYPTDGLVLTYDDVAYGKSLGVTAKTPKHSMAFKWQDETAETELIDIDWTVGRSGVITPTAVFKPVDLEGTTVERASLHNVSVMEELLGRPYVGQRIKVYKANMIIPQVIWGEKIDS